MGLKVIHQKYTEILSSEKFKEQMQRAEEQRKALECKE
jgi:hypothetical protein